MAWLALVAVLVVVTWLSRATTAGLPDQTGWVMIALCAMSAVVVLRGTPRRR